MFFELFLKPSSTNATMRDLKVGNFELQTDIAKILEEKVVKIMDSGFKKDQRQIIWLVVSTHLKNISQTGSFPQVGMKIKNI